MRARLMGMILAVCLAGSVLIAAGSAPLVQDRYHDDLRSTPKLLVHPAFFSKAGQASEDVARAYLSANAALFHLPADLSNLQLREVKESLLGRHFYFQQYLNGVPVDQAEIIVSIAWDGRVRQVFNNTYPQPRSKQLPAAQLKEGQALDIAWQHLRVHGDLINPPKAERVYVPEGADFRLVYKTQTDVEAPFGYWEHRIDAATGEVLSVRETAIDLGAQTREEKGFDRYAGPVMDRAAAVEACLARVARRDAAGKAEAVLASGTAKVFDPDPKSTLNSDTLLDNSPAASFTAAYFTRNLLDITYSGGTYSLVGPWVQIVNFEAPATAPSTSTTGNWTAERGNNAFNDVMTYFHIDQNQRYIQSLGYNNIQHGSIQADSDGLNEADNSHYIPSSNQIAYGHGGVDDNEDADVILHEYWHAIQHSINSSWGGNDTGAMGEGFGDCWPGAYGYEFPNGPTFHVDWSFHWDGHNSFWDGRQLDRTTAQYDPAQTYPAHTVVNGVNGDELWGTPVWQAFKDLRALGVPRTQVDTILLESNFGLGSGLKMPDMANAIVSTCQELYPAGPHAQKFYDRFVQVNILQTPCQMGPVTEGDNGANGVADPTETISLTVNLRNTGAATMTAVHGTLTTTTPGITITEAESDYENIPAGGNRNNLAPYRVQIPYGFPCGTTLAFTLQADYTDTASRTNNFSFTLPTGILQESSASVSPGLAIPDNNPAGVNSTITFSGTGETVAAGFNIDIHITHTYIGDLIVKLTSPDAVTVILHSRSGGTAENIVGNYPGTLTPYQSLGAFTGHPLDGTWTLNVSDNAGIDTGTLDSWGIHNPSGFGTYCEIAGDIDGNAVVEMRDAILGLEEINGFDTGIRVNAWADANGDGLITGAEIVFILEYLSGDWTF